MKKTIIGILFFSVLFISCKGKDDKIEIAKQYYSILNNSNYSKISTLLIDSLKTREVDYVKTYSQEEYIELLKWDSVFKPEYKILKIKEEDGVVKTKVSQKNKRILFLHEAPVVINQTIRFKNEKIVSVETINYVVFNDAIFSRNRTKLLNWVDKNHPELKGFLHDLTEKGGLKYLKAINLYQETN